MKIAQLTSSYPPMVSGAALFVEKLAGEMARCGHEVLVLTTSDRSYPYRMTGPRLMVERCRSYRNPMQVGQRIVGWPHRLLMARLEEFAPDVIHIHEPFQFGFSSLVYGRRQSVQVVFTIHQLPWFFSAYLPNAFLSLEASPDDPIVAPCFTFCPQPQRTERPGAQKKVFWGYLCVMPFGGLYYNYPWFYSLSTDTI